ncbi:MAG: hypothetical protein JSU75_12360 [Gammaproteobacteria bacterium]|nr:MAG: hypothetical protein JSU75_12360 [Gammaproteobacteria bacterium]
MSTRVTTTILLILLVLVSAASGVYHLKSRQEVEALKLSIAQIVLAQFPTLEIEQVQLF